MLPELLNPPADTQRARWRIPDGKRARLPKWVVVVVPVLPLVMLAARPIPAPRAPAVQSSRGYISTTPLSEHTAGPFNSVGASTLVVYVSSHPLWNNRTVELNGISDNKGNAWKLLSGPSLWSGHRFTLMSAIYYVNAPNTAIMHSVSVKLSNPAPLVLHIVGVSGSDSNVNPIYSPITSPGANGTSPDVKTAPITVPENSLLLSWTKNETPADAIATGDEHLDEESTGFLWAASQTSSSAGSYVGRFEYNRPIGWQTAIIALKPMIRHHLKTLSAIHDDRTHLQPRVGEARAY